MKIHNFSFLRRKGHACNSQNPHIDKAPSSNPTLFGELPGHQVALDRKHLARRGRDEAVDLARVLLHLAAVEHGLQAAGLLGQLEQPLPLVLGERRLLEGRAAGVLGLALGLPGSDLGLLAGQRPLVVLVVVGLGVVRLDALEEKIAVLLQVRVDAERQVVVVGVQNGVLDEGAGLQGGQGRGQLGGRRHLGALQLVDERGDQVRVVDLNRQFDEDILVSQVGLLQPAIDVRTDRGKGGR